MKDYCPYCGNTRSIEKINEESMEIVEYHDKDCEAFVYWKKQYPPATVG